MEKDFQEPIELKMWLLEKYGISDEPKTIDFCREAYKFLVEGDMMVYKGQDENGNHLVERLPQGIKHDGKGNVEMEGRIAPYIETSIKDDVYLVYADENGNRWYEIFTGHNKKDNAVGVAFKFGKVSLCLYDKNIKDCKMTTQKDEPCDYITSYAMAAHDFNGHKRTEMLFERGLSCKDRIPNGWFIPSIGELYVMYLCKTCINAALEYIGQDILEDKWYWSSTENSATYAWLLFFGRGGFFYGSYKTLETSVRPVSAFNPLSL